jgi:hypothetical protein
MSKSKKTDLGLCPFRELKTCDEKCQLFRQGTIFIEKEDKHIPVQGCAFTFILNNLEAMNGRSFQMQREVSDAKNIMTFETLSKMGVIPQEEAASKIVKIIAMSDQKLLK